ncbi:MAG: TolC family protein [Bdellovibrio sp.]|nr:TolC family protein [Bdellovibrio sp.]
MVIINIGRIFQVLLVLDFILPAQAIAYSFEDYLQDVRGKNSALQGAIKSIQGSLLRSNEAALYHRPSFFFNGQYSDDQRPTAAPAFQGSETIRKTFQSGLTHQFQFGAKASLSYNISETTIIGASPALLPESNFFDMAPAFELTQSLWKNWLGRETKANEEIIEAQVNLINNSEKYRFKQLLMSAEINYWRLALAQKTVKVQAESLERSSKIKDWNYARFHKGLADESDYLQSTSALTAREIDYQTALMEERSATRAFNTLRESEDEIVREELRIPQEEELLALPIPKRVGNREDVEASLAQKKLLQAQAVLGEERNTPVLELYGSYSLNGRADTSAPAMSQSLGQDHPATVVGVRFNTPLDIANFTDNKKGYAHEILAAQYNYERKLIEQEREWEDLVNRFKDYQDRLLLIQKMEQAQKEKLAKEKVRLNRGRSTTFQILQFEQDYANAQLLKLKNQADLITTYAQLKLFSGVIYE